MYPLMYGETELEDGEASPICRRRGLNSGKIRTMDSLVTKRIKWPHEMVITSQGQPPVYDGVHQPGSAPNL